MRWLRRALAVPVFWLGGGLAFLGWVFCLLAERIESRHRRGTQP